MLMWKSGNVGRVPLWSITSNCVGTVLNIASRTTMSAWMLTSMAGLVTKFELELPVEAGRIERLDRRAVEDAPGDRAQRQRSPPPRPAAVRADPDERLAREGLSARVESGLGGEDDVQFSLGEAFLKPPASDRSAPAP